MGKKNVYKRRELESQQSISGGVNNNKRSKRIITDNKSKGLSKQDLSNLYQFGTKAGEQTNLEEEEEIDGLGQSYTFNQQGELIENVNEVINDDNKVNNSIDILGLKVDLKELVLGNNNNINKNESLKLLNNNNKVEGKKFNKLLSLIGGNKKKKSEESAGDRLKAKLFGNKIIKDNEKESELLSLKEDELSEFDEEIGDGGVLSDQELISNDNNESEESVDSEDELIFNVNSVYKLHFSDQSYGEKELINRINLIEKKEINQKLVYTSNNNNNNNNDYQIIVSNFNDDNEINWNKIDEDKNLSELNVKPRLINAFNKVKDNKRNINLNIKLSTQLFSIMNSYKDILYPILNDNNGGDIKRAYVLHALNHCYKVRDTIIKNNFKLAKAQTNGTDPGEIRDSSFTRAKVLILVPFRSAALEVMQWIIRLSGCEQVENKKRFIDEFAIPPDAKDSLKNSKLPDDHKKTFNGNSDDCFKVGIKLTRKSLKLYSPFYTSDIIIASPLGLKLILGDNNNNNNNNNNNKNNNDFLSSLELLIIDQADHLIMQNYDHCLSVIESINQIPVEMHDCDISRLKSYYANNQCKYLRQSLIFSKYNTPELNSTFQSQFKNIEGKIKFIPTFKNGDISTIPKIINDNVKLKFQFDRINLKSHLEQDDKRFSYFVDSILPIIRNKSDANVNTLIFIQSYLDFTRIRNYLKDHEYKFGMISEYSSVSDVTRDRMAFANGNSNILLYTERCHFYRRYKLKGINQLIFYSLPDNPIFYSELTQSIQPTNLDNEIKVLSIYTKFDTIKLERLIGGKKAHQACFGNREKILLE